MHPSSRGVFRQVKKKLFDLDLVENDGAKVKVQVRDMDTIDGPDILGEFRMNITLHHAGPDASYPDAPEVYLTAHLYAEKGITYCAGHRKKYASYSTKKTPQLHLYGDSGSYKAQLQLRDMAFGGNGECVRWAWLRGGKQFDSVYNGP
jgi:hypothetical protein